MRKILIADCDVDCIVNLKQVFEKNGYEVALTSSGYDALNMVLNDYYFVVLLSIRDNNYWYLRFFSYFFAYK